MLQVFSTRRVVASAPAIRQIAAESCAAVQQLTPPVDLHAAFSVPFCSRVILHLLGIDRADLFDLQQWTEEGAIAADIDRSLRGMRSLLTFAGQQVRARRSNPIDDDVVAQLVAANGASDRPDLGRVIKLLAGMLAFGRETPASALSTAVALLLERPETVSRVRASPRLQRLAVEEALRMFTPPAATPDGLLRYAHCDLQTDGVTLRRGDMVLVDVARANFDPAVFDQPGTFCVDRDPNPHLTFGSGFYLCNFARLARLQIFEALAALLGSFPSLAKGAGPVLYNLHLRTRSIAELEVTW